MGGARGGGSWPELADADVRNGQHEPDLGLRQPDDVAVALVEREILGAHPDALRLLDEHRLARRELPVVDLFHVRPPPRARIDLSPPTSAGAQAPPRPARGREVGVFADNIRPRTLIR